MSGGEDLNLKDLGEIFLEQGRDSATSEARKAISDALNNELSFMEITEPEIVVENPENEDSGYHARYLATEDRIEFSPSIRENTPNLRETSIHELFHKQQDSAYFGFAQTQVGYDEALDLLVENIDDDENRESGLLDRFKKRIGWKSPDEDINQKLFLEESIGHEGALPALFTLYSDKYSSEIPDLAEEIENHYHTWKEVQEERRKYTKLIGAATLGFGASEILGPDHREVMKIDNHRDAIEKSTDEYEIKSHLQAIDTILDENNKEYRGIGVPEDSTVAEMVNASEMARYNQKTQEALENVRLSLANRINDKEDLQDPLPKYFQEGFAHAASVVALGIIGNEDEEKKYWKNQVEKPYNHNLSYKQKAGTKAREIGEEVVEQVKGLETEKEMYKKLVDIQDEKVEDYRITV